MTGGNQLRCEGMSIHVHPLSKNMEGKIRSTVEWNATTKASVFFYQRTDLAFLFALVRPRSPLYLFFFFALIFSFLCLLFC
jgi:hypothetical protein